MAYKLEIWKHSMVETEITESKSEKQDVYTAVQQYDLKDIPLRLIVRKKKYHGYRALDVSFFDTLSYYRAYMLSVINHCNIYLRFQFSQNYNLVVSHQFFRVFEGPLACFFIQMFLGMYVPHTHLYISKMTPLYSGSDLLHFLGAVLELTRFVDAITTFLTYFVEGVVRANPWNRCAYSSHNFVYLNNKSISIECLLPDQFVSRISNHSKFHFLKGQSYSCYFYEGSNTCISTSQIFFSHAHTGGHEEMNAFYQMLVWTLATCFCTTIYKNRVWKSLSIVNCGLFSTHIVFLLYVKIFLEMGPVKSNIKVHTKDSLTFWEMLTHMWATYVQMPPVVHIVTARRSEPTTPGRESPILLITITVYCMLYFYVHHILLEYASCYVTIDLRPVMNSFYVETPFFYMFIFFWHMTFGNLVSLFYLAMHAVHEFLIFLITYQLVIELIVEQYKWIGRYLAVTTVTLFGLCLNMTVINKIRVILHAYIKSVILVIELTAIYFFYPLRRLLDDMYFYYGTALSKFWHIVLYAYPFTMMNKLLRFEFAGYSRVKHDMFFNDMDLVFYASSAFIAATLVLGAVYMMFKLHLNKQKIACILCPVKSWGPWSFTSRQLRKQFDSRENVSSLAPKVLSRYLIRMAEPDKYRLGIDFEHIASTRRPLTVAEAFEMVDQDKY